jgi:endonuclease YncB( thermonuclease family)
MTRHMRLAWLAVVGALGCTPKAPPADINSGDEVQVVRATTRGHELVVTKGGKKATVRLVGIYTFSTWPREKTDVTTFAQAAIDFVTNEVGGRPAKLVLIRKELDPRGRYLGFLEMNGADLGQRLIEEGLAAVYTEYPFDREEPYMAAETKPRSTKQGIWSGRVAAKRLSALRQTWASVRLREFNNQVSDPLLGK